MGRSVLEDAFAYHVWATLRLADACLSLGPEQLDTAVPGTYGSILETVRHLVGADSWYLFSIARCLGLRGTEWPRRRTPILFLTTSAPMRSSPRLARTPMLHSS
jgi:uncharacterized damage-inducible protein DinB